MSNFIVTWKHEDWNGAGNPVGPITIIDVEKRDTVPCEACGVTIHWDESYCKGCGADKKLGIGYPYGETPDWMEHYANGGWFTRARAKKVAKERGAEFKEV